MQSPGMTLKIEMFGHLVEELSYWQKCCDEEAELGGEEFQYCEDEFTKVLAAIRDFRTILIEDLDIYVKNCKEDGIPIDLGYWRIKRQLEESTFSLVNN